MLRRRLFLFFWTILIAAWMLPLLRPYVKLWNERPLDGAVSQTEMPPFSWRDWHEGTFQQQTETSLGQGFGLRPSLVRLRNQLAFTLYGDISARNVVMGREGYLFEQNYLDAYYGTDYLGEADIREQVHAMRTIQDSLARQGKLFLLVFAAGKATYFSEYRPDPQVPPGTNTNYGTFQRLADSAGLNYIDCQAWFLAMKDTSSYPLYPQTGTHWSNYGAAVVMDSLLGYLSDKLDRNLAKMNWERVEWVDRPQSPDMDIELGMNLLLPLERYPTASPVLAFDTTGAFMPRVLTIADSYYWQFLNRWLAQKAFDRPAFWYYYNEYYEHGFPGVRTRDQLDLATVLSEQDVVILMATEGTIGGLGWGFIGNAKRVLEE